jgi:hypothetical protein
VRVMDPVLDGKHPHPNGYASYPNAQSQTIDPYTGKILGKSDPARHLDFEP